MTKEAYDFIQKLLAPNPADRLGCNGAANIKAHPWFEGINWDTLYSQSMEDVFVPKPLAIDDTAYFGNVLELR